jgi:hypothetical protein
MESRSKTSGEDGQEGVVDKVKDHLKEDAGTDELALHRVVRWMRILGHEGALAAIRGYQRSRTRRLYGRCDLGATCRYSLG